MFLQILVSVAMGSSYLVKAPSANPHEYFVHAQNSGDAKISSYFLTCPHSESLKTLFKEAQYHFLNSSLDRSRDKFTALADLKWSCDWQDEERKILAFSFFRLAQMSEKEPEKINHLTMAVQFDEVLAPDISIFPPPLLETYKAVKSQLKKNQYTFPAFVKKYSYILRNGRFQSLNGFVFEAYPLRARITLVSDSYRLETFVITPEELADRSVEPLPLVQGDCASYSLAEEIKNVPGIKVFFDASCNKEAPTQLTAAVHPVTMSSKIEEMPDFPQPARKNWLQRNYLWVGAVIAGSLLISHQMSKKDEGPQTVYVPSNTLSQQP